MALLAAVLLAGAVAVLAVASLVRLRTSRRAIGALEERLVRAQKLESLGLLAGSVAHDFNNLLAAIRGYGELLLKESAGPNADRANEILKAADRASQLTRQLLTFSRREPHEAEPLDVGELVQETSSMLERLVGPRVTLEVDVEDHPVVRGDGGRLQQVLLNLVVNARDAMPEGGVLRIAVARRAPNVVIEVSDTGTGVAPDLIPRIFDPFFTTKAPGAGTGLGLATVEAIVRRYGGSVDVDSTLGEGATFSVTLPAIA